MTRKEFIQTTALAAGSVLLPQFAFGENQRMAGVPELNALRAPFSLPTLPYGYGALQPAIDAQTMEIHHSKHHAAYVNNLNNALKGSRFADMTLGSILANVESGDAAAIRNNAGGHWNHSFFWTLMQPAAQNSGKPSGELLKAIERDFASWDGFKKQFSDAAKGCFGSGWAWLSLNAERKLVISATPNQDNPLMAKLVAQRGTPLLGLDVWEHAYYLTYQNRRADYVEAFFSLINWSVVEAGYAAAMR